MCTGESTNTSLALHASILFLRDFDETKRESTTSVVNHINVDANAHNGIINSFLENLLTYLLENGGSGIGLAWPGQIAPTPVIPIPCPNTLLWFVN